MESLRAAERHWKDRLEAAINVNSINADQNIVAEIYNQYQQIGLRWGGLNRIVQYAEDIFQDSPDDESNAEDIIQDISDDESNAEDVIQNISDDDSNWMKTMSFYALDIFQDVEE